MNSTTSAPFSQSIRTTGPRRAMGSIPALPLVVRLGEALSARGIRYCQWKGHGRQERWGTGRGDIDLLVDASAWPEFSDVLCHLGFKLAVSPVQDVAGGQHFFGLDPQTRRLVHVHASIRLVVGSPWRRRYRLPLETAVLESRGGSRTVFSTPAPPLELLLFVVRQTLRHSWRDLFRASPRWLREARQQLEQLAGGVSQPAFAEALAQHLPHVGLELFQDCLRTFYPAMTPWRRLLVSARLRRRLRPFALPVSAAAVWHALLHRHRGSGLRLAGGGAVIALLGGDGAGKSTCARALTEWLAAELDTRRFHLGLPPRGGLTFLAGAALKAVAHLPWAGLVDHLDLLRSTCTARDRLRAVRRAWQQAAGGGIAICERYPIPENWVHAGPTSAQGRLRSLRSRFADSMRRWETALYRQMPRPDVVFVLRVPVDEAVRRKPGEPADYVRDRNRSVAQVDWGEAGAEVIDAAGPLPEVVATLQRAVWKAL